MSKNLAESMPEGIAMPLAKALAVEHKHGREQHKPVTFI
jgi:hypothetical protein